MKCWATMLLMTMLLVPMAPAQDSPATPDDPRGVLVSLWQPMPPLEGRDVGDRRWSLETGERTATILIMVSAESALSTQLLESVEEFLWQPLRTRGLKMAVIVRGASVEEARALAERHGLTCVVVPDPDGAIIAQVAPGGRGLPRMLVLDGEALLAWHHVGYRPGREAEARAVAEALLAGRPIPRYVSNASAGARGPADDPQAGFVGRPLPEIPVEAWITREPGDTEGKYVLTEFWATWCGPCIAVMPHLQELSLRFPDRLVIRSISDEPAIDIAPFVEEHGFTYPIGSDTRGRGLQMLGIRGIPHGFLTNPEGVVVWQGHPATLTHDEVLLPLLGLGAPKPPESSTKTGAP